MIDLSRKGQPIFPLSFVDNLDIYTTQHLKKIGRANRIILLKDVQVKEYRIKILNVINKNIETIGKTQQYNWVIIQIITNISKKTEFY